VNKVIKKGHLIWGEMQERLQANFSQMTGKKHAVTFNSDTSALEALFSILMRSGCSTFAFQGNCFPSPAFAARRQGAKIKWVDIDIVAMAPRIDQLEAALPFDVLVLQYTAGFVPDWVGEIAEWCRQRGIFFIEDCAQAVGTMKNGKYAGSFGDAAGFSLAATKPLMTGQGGVLVTDDGEIAERLFYLKNYGRTQLFMKGDYVDEGWNSHMTEVQAAVGVALFQTFEGRIEERTRLAAVYDKMLCEIGTPLGHRGGRPNFYKYPFLLPERVPKAEVKRRMLESGIELGSSVYDFVTPHLSVFKGEYEAVKLPETIVYAGRHICLPMHNLLTEKDAEYVARRLIEIVRE